MIGICKICMLDNIQQMNLHHCMRNIKKYIITQTIGVQTMGMDIPFLYLIETQQTQLSIPWQTLLRLCKTYLSVLVASHQFFFAKGPVKKPCTTIKIPASTIQITPTCLVENPNLSTTYSPVIPCKPV